MPSTLKDEDELTLLLTRELDDVWYFMHTLGAKQIAEILDFLQVKQASVDLDTLRALVQGYVHRIPWESTTRIVRRSETPQLADRPRWPAEFWQLAMSQGTGGTCFESNYAFWKLLESIGFQGYLTINDMGETHACHSAIVIDLRVDDGANGTHQRYLVDVGLPLYTPIPLDPAQTTSAESEYQRYSIQSLDADSGTGPYRYQVERAPHPRPTAYTLIDTPVHEDTYLPAVTADYDQNGLFLDTVVIAKLVDGIMSRFSTHEKPYVLEFFVDGERTTRPLPSDLRAAAQVIGAHFGMPSDVVEKSLRIIDIT